MSAVNASVGTRGRIRYDMGLVRVGSPGSGNPAEANFRFTATPRRTPSAAGGGGIAVISSGSPSIFTIKAKNVNGVGREHDYSVQPRPAGQVFAVSGSNKLKELLLSQLDLIQEQSELLLKKDQQLQQLQKENRDLLSKLSRFNEVPADELLSKERRKVDKCVETSKELLEQNSANAKQRTRKNSCSIKKTPVVAAEAVADATEKLETTTPYFTLNGEERVRAEKESMKDILSQSEVPQWRFNPVSPLSGSGSGNSESDDEEAILRRHKKPEIQEKQRKRWDVQRMRQLKQVEHLRRTELQEVQVGQGDVAGDKDGERIRTFFPDPAGIEEIIVSDSLPVCAFGFQIPDLGAKNQFSLPWSDCDH